jgi:hypothetical protein
MVAGVIRSAKAVSSSVPHIDCTPPGYAGVAAPVTQARHDPLVSSRPAADAIRQLQPPDNRSPTLISITSRTIGGNVAKAVPTARSSVLEISHEDKKTGAFARRPS